MNRDNYWTRRVARRRVLAGSATMGAGLAGLALVGCGGDDDDEASPTQGSNGSATPSGGETTTPGDGGPKIQGEIINGEEKYLGKTPQRGGTLNTTFNADPPTWDIHTTTSVNTFLATAFTTSPMIQYSHGPEHGTANVRVQANIAESWEYVDDTTLTFKLNPKAVWNESAPMNGRQITSSDIKYTYERILQTPAPFAGLYTPIDAIETPDDQTLTIKLKHAYAPIQNYLAHYYAAIVAPEVVEQFGDLKSADAAKVMSSGAFELEDFTAGTSMTFKRRENYWQDVWLDRVIRRNSPDANANLAAFRAGELDTIGLTDDNLDSVIGSRPDAIVDRSLTVVAYELSFRTDVEPMNDPRVRQAVALGIDRRGWLESLYRGHGALNNGPVQALWSDWLLPESELGEGAQYLEYDPERGKALLAEAGVDNLSTDFLFTNAYGQGGVTQAELYKDFLGQLGIELNIQILDYADYISQVLNSNPTYPHTALTLVRFMGDPDEMLWEMYHPEGSKNFSKVNDPEVTALLEKQRATLEYEERKLVVDDLQRMLSVKNYYVYSPAQTQLTGWQPWVAGYRPHVSYDSGNNLRGTWIDTSLKS